MPTKNHFAVLGIDIGSDENQIKKAYRTLAKKWHPDKNKDAGAKEKFQEIAASYEYLSSTDRREMLERELRKGTAPSFQANQSYPQQQQQQKQKPQGTGFGRSDFSNTSQTSGASSTKSSSSSTKPSKPRSGGSAKSKQQRAPHWSDSFTKNNSRGQQQAGAATDGGDGKSSGKSGKGAKDPPKFDFRSYASTPSGDEEDTIFQELFGDFFYNAMGFGGLSGRFDPGPHPTGKPRAPRPRNVANETGFAEGLDEEYMFTPRRGHEDSTEKLPCPWCGQLFTRGKLGQHEEKCGKFGLSAEEDEDEEDDFDDDFDSDDVEDGFSYYSNSSSVRPPGYARRPSWQQKHAKTRSKIRRDKMRYRDRVASQGARNAGFVTCPYCLREFSSEAGTKHMPWCKEHTERFGRPLNPKPTMPGASSRHRGSGDVGGGTLGDRGRGTAAPKTTGPESSRRATFNKAHEVPKEFYSYGHFSQKEDIPPRTGNDQPFPTHGPKFPDMFNIHGTRLGQSSRPSRGPKVTIGLGRGPKISVGISTNASSNDTHNFSGPSAKFTAQAGRKPNGAFNVRFNLNTNIGNKNKPGSYASSFGSRR
ncbi:hypothetical protein RRG08_065484 [Elysia crispata]|uniref:DnaJ homolog subfamily B member 9 n=1 Tax=Elysia crispata TaxID=231223 RepID=A0AAE1AQ25_9GAST|nr:hypothetical protein RRG08_065484 [Elysia crispata]